MQKQRQDSASESYGPVPGRSLPMGYQLKLEQMQ